jgi:hypothetical protein
VVGAKVLIFKSLLKKIFFGLSSLYISTFNKNSFFYINRGINVCVNFALGDGQQGNYGMEQHKTLKEF